MKRELIIRRIRIPLYNSKVIVVLFKPESYDKVIRYLKKKKVDYTQFDNKCDGILYHLEGKDRANFLVVIKQDKDQLETAIHELWHLNQAILEFHGVEYRQRTNNEAYAYLMGILSKKILPLLEQQTNNGRNIQCINPSESQSL